MKPATQHERRPLCTLLELREGPGGGPEGQTGAIDWTIWNSIRPDPARDGSIAALLDLLSDSRRSEPASGEPSSSSA